MIFSTLSKRGSSTFVSLTIYLTDYVSMYYLCLSHQSTYTRKNLTSCSKSANKPSTSCVRTLVTSCQQVWNKLLTTCINLVDIVRLVTRFFQQGCYNHDITILLQPCVVNLVTFLLYHNSIRLVRTTL